MRYKICVEYDGAPFVGWQRQNNGPSVQGALERAIKAFSGETSTIFGAGRTDSGVHALGQVAHFDVSRVYSEREVLGAMNHFLRPDPVAILSAEAVPDTFHARFSALARHYLYRILCRRARPVLLEGKVWHVPHPLDACAMQVAAQRLVGTHDFTTFRSSECQAKSPVKSLDRLDVRVNGDEIEIRADARSFLHRQVRSMVGTLKMAGEGKWTPDDVEAALHAADRKACGTVAPPDGLYFVSVDYPADGAQNPYQPNRS